MFSRSFDHSPIDLVWMGIESHNHVVLNLNIIFKLFTNINNQHYGCTFNVNDNFAKHFTSPSHTYVLHIHLISIALSRRNKRIDNWRTFKWIFHFGFHSILADLFLLPSWATYLIYLNSLSLKINMNCDSFIIEKSICTLFKFNFVKKKNI